MSLRLENLLNYLQSGKNKKLLSFGGANFLRKANYRFHYSDYHMIQFTHDIIDNKKYNLNVLTGLSDDTTVQKILPYGKKNCN